jgi:imidazolonepropionase-like amidohydrolase
MRAAATATAVCCAAAGVGLAALRVGRRPFAGAVAGYPRGLALRGTVWPGGSADPFDGLVVVAAGGTVARLGPPDLVLPADLPVLGGPGYWIGPGLVDAHVHLAFGDPAEMLAKGVVGVRDLGAPPDVAQGWRTLGQPPSGSPSVAVAGPLITAPGGYPSRSWGAGGFAVFASSPAAARRLVADLVADGTDLIKIALEPGAGAPVPGPAEVRAVTEAAHAAGLPVTAHALTAEMVSRALDAGVDELCHVPTERLSPALAERIAASGIAVVSTLQTFFSDGKGAAAARNAIELHRCGVPLLYGTDLGNAGTRSGADPRELDRLACAGLGRLGALRAATEGSAGAVGMRGRTGRIAEGEAAALVMLTGDPLVEPGVWHTPALVLADTHLITP